MSLSCYSGDLTKVLEKYCPTSQGIKWYSDAKGSEERIVWRYGHIRIGNCWIRKGEILSMAILQQTRHGQGQRHCFWEKLWQYFWQGYWPGHCQLVDSSS